MTSPRYAIILAAGKGTRMHSEQTPKVCFEVNGVPAILRAMRIYARTGIRQFIVVIGGELAGKVMETVSSEFSNVVYACQPAQDGTAGAVRCALQALTTIDDDDDLLVVAGDRLIASNTLEQFYETHYESRADLSVLALVRSIPTSQGHILRDKNGTPMAIVEMADIRQRRAYARLQAALAQGTEDSAALLSILTESFFPAGSQPQSSKALKAFGELCTDLSEKRGAISQKTAALIRSGKTDFRFPTPQGIATFSPDEAEASPYRNNSVYLVKRRTLHKALDTFTRDNAQQEIYLSDILYAAYRLGMENGAVRTSVLNLDDPDKILGFNNPSELLEVEKTLLKEDSPARKPLQPGLLKPLSEWQRLFDEALQPDSPFHHTLQGIYGNDEQVIQRQSSEMRRLAHAAALHFAADTPLMFTRAPGRINTMGRHVDHQGGNCNLMTISFETMMFIAQRPDDKVTLTHCDPLLFAPDSFSIGELLAALPWEDWNTLVNSPRLIRRIKEKGIGWTDYIRAAILRVQKKFRKTPLSGMDILVSGNIPMAAGLSSSSSLVVCMTEALIHLNSLDTFPSQFITLCGEGEWYVGTHGGNADHAAVKLGECGAITKVHFFDFGIEKTIPFPTGYSLLVCDSGIKARKSDNAKDQFNHRVSCYRIGLQLIRKFCPQYQALLPHLRDVNTQNLHVSLRTIYKMILMLPENPTRSEIEQMLPEADKDQLFAGHDSTPERHYPIRSVVLYGLSEMQRSAKFADALERTDMAAIAQMLRNSHDGDRVVAHDEQLREIPHVPKCSNEYLMGLLDDLESGELERVARAQLDRQSGAYACSIPQIDLMVDIANRTPGVVGAQLAGAGLGGCMMILTAQDAIPELKQRLIELYYAPANIQPCILVCRPVSGAGVIL